MTPLKLLHHMAKSKNTAIKTSSDGETKSHFIIQGRNQYGVDITNDGQYPFVWGLPDTHEWVTLCNKHNHHVDIF